MLEDIRLTKEELKEAVDKYWHDNTITRTPPGALEVSANAATDKAIKWFNHRSYGTDFSGRHIIRCTFSFSREEYESLKQKEVNNGL